MEVVGRSLGECLGLAESGLATFLADWPSRCEVDLSLDAVPCLRASDGLLS